MHYEISYKDMPREEADVKAIQDIRDYCSQEQWDTLMIIVGEMRAGKYTVNNLNFAFGMMGISGKPFHAFCRKYILEQYKEWMRSEEPVVEVDEQGFPLEVKEIIPTSPPIKGRDMEHK